MLLKKKSFVLASGAALLSASIAGCGGTSASPKTVTLTFATQGLGSEATATKDAIKGFEKLHPNIHVNIDTLSASANQAYQTLVTQLSSGSKTPDVITSDVIWPSTFASAHWIMSLNRFHPNVKTFFPGMVQAGTYQGKLYAMPWFINVEGLYYRTDLVKTPPTTFSQLVSDAQTVVAKHPGMIGLAFEGAKYEGAVTVFQDVSGGFGGSFLNKKGQPVINSKQNVAALTWLNSLIKNHVSPSSVTGWQEGNVQTSFLSGQSVFATNWPYLYPLAEQSSSSSVKGKVGFVAPPVQGGHPTASLGGDSLVINKNTQYPKQAWELVKYLTSAKVMQNRALIAGDPPARSDSYTPKLFSKAPWFKQEKTVYQYATPRPVTPLYPRISTRIQTALSAVYSGQMTPQQALNQAQAAVVKLMKSHG